MQIPNYMFKTMKLLIVIDILKVKEFNFYFKLQTNNLQYNQQNLTLIAK